MDIVARRYARALLDALSSREPSEGLVQLRRAASLLEAEPDARQFLTNPGVPPDRREDFIEKIAEPLGLSSEVRRLLSLLVDRRRLSLLDDIVESYQKLLDEEQGIVRAVVRVAGPLSETEREGLLAKLEESTGKRVVMEVDQDPSLIGGVVVQMGSTVLDGSIRQHLYGFKERFLAS